MGGVLGREHLKRGERKSSSFWSNLWPGRLDVKGIEQMPFVDRQECLKELWLSEVLSEWEISWKSERATELCYAGVPVMLRGKVWGMSIGNDLQIDPSMYSELVQLARDRRAQCDGDDIYAEKNRLLAKTVEHLHIDVPRTMPHLEVLQDQQPVKISENVGKVLEAFLMLRPDIGYSQGMLFLSSMLLLYMDPEDAFVAFTNLLDKSRLLDFYRNSADKVELYMNAFVQLISEKLPKLQGHFVKLGVEPSMFLLNWLMSAYCRVLPLDLASRVWDLFVSQGDTTLFGVALAILESLEEELLTLDFDSCLRTLSQLRKRTMDQDALIRGIRKIGLSEKSIDDALRKCSRK
uniref:Rab-GAP TBC domain-containing protein n=1 Tax=Rhodosorus marinus TaxID=101924 RepID=A0A7S0G2T1_9RHOD